MKRRILIACGVALGLGTILMVRTPPANIKKPRMISSEDAPASSDNVELNAPMEEEPRAEGAHVENAPVHEESPHDRKVQAALTRFIEKTADITKKSVADERERIAQGLERARSRQTIEPHVDEEEDSLGYRWLTLDYGDGIVRYVPADDQP